MKKLVIILDPAHGEEVAGKRSPDGLFREYK
jgi:N-acetylmuramoyl-L-alanine amidase